MKLLEFEAKQIFQECGIPIPQSKLISHARYALSAQKQVSDHVVLKAQVNVGGRGKAGGVLSATKENVTEVATELFNKTINGIPVTKILVEEALDIQQEYYLSIIIDRTSKMPIIIFSDQGGMDIEKLAKEKPEAIRRVCINPFFTDVPDFLMRTILKDAPKEIWKIVNDLYHVYIKYDALLVEINPLVHTSCGFFAADSKIILDDNALNRQGISVNRELSVREAKAAKYGFSYVELDGDIGVIGNGAGLTMATLDLISFYHGKAANFLDIGGGASTEIVAHAVRLVSSNPSVKVIVVNLLGGITKCDDVAYGIINAGVSQPVIARLAGTNESLGQKLLNENGFMMLDTMEEVIQVAIQKAKQNSSEANQ